MFRELRHVVCDARSRIQIRADVASRCGELIIFIRRKQGMLAPAIADLLLQLRREPCQVFFSFEYG